MAELTPRMQWPYPSVDEDPWYAKEVDYKNAVDVSGYASREDRHLILAEGGNVSWVLGTETLAWSAILQIAAPVTGFLWQVAAGNVVLANGEVLYVTLSRGPGANTAVTAAKASTVPSNDGALVLAIRVGDVIWWRNGLRLADGDVATSISPVSLGGGGGVSDLQGAWDGGNTIATAGAETIQGAPNNVAGVKGGGSTYRGGKGGDGTGGGGKLGGATALIGGEGGSDAVLGAGADGAPSSVIGGDAGWPGFGNGGLGGDGIVDGGLDPSGNNNGGRVLVGQANAREILSGHSAAAGSGVPWTHEGTVRLLAPALFDLLGTPGFEVEPQKAETQGTRSIARWLKYNDAVAAVGASIEILAVNGDPNGQVTAGDPGSLAIDPNTGTVYGKDSNPSTWSPFSKGSSGGITVGETVGALN